MQHTSTQAPRKTSPGEGLQSLIALLLVIYVFGGFHNFPYVHLIVNCHAIQHKLSYDKNVNFSVVYHKGTDSLWGFGYKEAGSFIGGWASSMCQVVSEEVNVHHTGQIIYENQCIQNIMYFMTIEEHNNRSTFDSTI